MPQNNQDSLAGQFAGLIAEREKSWDPARLAKNAADRRELVERFDPAAVAQPGERLEAVGLIDAAGEEIELDELVKNGPAVLLFFRFGECPACNIALPHYDRRLRPALEAAGLSLLAISPQLPDRLQAFKERQQLGLRLASDPGNRLARRLGITFLPSPIPEGPPPADWIGELTGTGTWELPQPSVLVLERDLTIRSLHVSPDWLNRPEAEEILGWAIPHKDRQAA